MVADLEFRPLTPENWDDFEHLFGARGACGGCWCMFFRLNQKDFDSYKGFANRQSMYDLVHSGKVPGILAYVAGQPAAWCAVAPRQEYSRLARSRIFKPIDDQFVWSVVCFFVARGYRRQGVTSRLLVAAIDFARSQGAKILEGYPEQPQKDKAPDVFLYTGIFSAFQKAGFQEVARRSPNRPMMRYYIEEVK